MFFNVSTKNKESNNDNLLTQNKIVLNVTHKQ